MCDNENENKNDDEKDNIYKKIKNKSIITYEEFMGIIFVMMKKNLWKILQQNIYYI